MAKDPKPDPKKDAKFQQVVRTMLKTPPKPHKPKEQGGEKKAPRRPRRQSKSNDN